MRRLAWLIGVAGTGGAALALALLAPSQAWWLLTLLVLAMLAGPHAAQWWLRRAPRTGRRAAHWWAANPDPVEVAYLCGGPDRVIDLVVSDMVADGRLTVDDSGRLTADGPEEPRLTFSDEILERLSHGTTDIAALRFAAHAAMPSLWHQAARQRLLLSPWRRENTPWYLAGSVVAVSYGVAVALGQLGRADLTLGIGVGAVALGVLAVWRARFLVGYGFDPRTAAGLRAADVARAADCPDARRHRIAVAGIRSAADLRPGATDRHPVPISRWHIPWYGSQTGSAPKNTENQHQSKTRNTDQF